MYYESPKQASFPFYMTVLSGLECVPTPCPRLPLSRLRCLVFFVFPLIGPTSYSPVCLVVAFLGFWKFPVASRTSGLLRWRIKNTALLRQLWYLNEGSRLHLQLCTTPGYCPAHGPRPHSSRPVLALTCSFLLQPKQNGP